VKLPNKIAVITGGERGIGLAIASKLVNEGATVVADINKEDDEKGFSYRFIKCDISIKEEVDKTIKQVVEEFKRVDILINNAGINRDALITKMPKE